jgi:hypothetical protein
MLGMKKTALFFILLLAMGPILWAQQKYALVIGNGDYTSLSRLNNPVNDANDMAAVLDGLGFTVDKVLDGTLDQMEDAIMRLKNRLSVSRESYGFFYYAGHGVQSNGVNYLIPVGVNIPSENFLREHAVSVQAMLDELNDAHNALNIIVLDACRDNPFGWGRSGSRGLTVVGNQPTDSIIVFATSAGSAASDSGGTGRNGLFTWHLLNNLRTPGLEVTEVFRLTMGDVALASNNQQRPAVYNQFPGLAYLGSWPSPGSNLSSNPAPTPVPIPVPPPVPDGLAFVIVGNRSVTITGYTGSAVTLGIPERIQDLQVTSIRFGSFYNCRSLTSVTLSRRTQVGRNVFPESAQISYSD